MSNEELLRQIQQDGLRKQTLQEALGIQPPLLEIVPSVKRRSTRVRKVPLVVHVQPDVLEWAKRMACEHGRSVSSYINMALGKLAAAKSP